MRKREENGPVTGFMLAAGIPLICFVCWIAASAWAEGAPPPPPGFPTNVRTAPLVPGERPEFMKGCLANADGKVQGVIFYLDVMGAKHVMVRDREGRSYSPWITLHHVVGGNDNNWKTSETIPIPKWHPFDVQYALGNDNGWKYGTLARWSGPPKNTLEFVIDATDEKGNTYKVPMWWCGSSNVIPDTVSNAVSLGGAGSR